jgi:uncharacterized protein DUF4390
MMRTGRETAPLPGALFRPGVRLRLAGMPHTPRPLRSSVSPRRHFLRALAAGLVVAHVAGVALAGDIPVMSASLSSDGDEILLSAEFDVDLTPALEQALDKGVPLYFTIEFELTRPRLMWFPDKVAAWSITYRVSYSALTRQYRVSSGPLGQTFESLGDVERFIGHVASRPVAATSEVAKGVQYEAGVRMKLDVNQLPKPFQVNALASRDWQLASDWYRFGFTP